MSLAYSLWSTAPYRPILAAYKARAIDTLCSLHANGGGWSMICAKRDAAYPPKPDPQSLRLRVHHVSNPKSCPRVQRTVETNQARPPTEEEVNATATLSALDSYKVRTERVRTFTARQRSGVQQVHQSTLACSRACYDERHAALDCKCMPVRWLPTTTTMLKGVSTAA